MKRKLIHPGQSIGLRLTAAERTLLVEGILVLDRAYITRITDSPSDRHHVPFSLDELDELAGYVASEANHCKNKKKQKVLDAIYGKIQHLLETHSDDEEAVRSDALAEAAVTMIMPSYTCRQGQYLAFIHYYTKLNCQPPSEADMQRHFKVTPPSVHDMILMLEKRGLIERTPGMARSIRVLLPREQLPELK